MIRFFIVLAFVACASGAHAENWREEKSDHFFLYYLASPLPENPGVTQKLPDIETFNRECLYKAEGYYERIAQDLGYQRVSDFWTWDHRAKIYIYPDRASFIASGNYPSWFEGVADYEKKAVIGYRGSQQFVDSVLPHEIAHLIFREFVGFRDQIPDWLDEGVAQYTEEAKRSAVRIVIKDMYTRDSLLTIEDMTRLDIKLIKSQENVFIRQTRTKTGEPGVLFLTGNNLVKTYYIQAVSLVCFLIEQYGKTRFTDFCRELRDGKNVENALTAAYPDHIKNLGDFEKQWRAYIRGDA